MANKLEAGMNPRIVAIAGPLRGMTFPISSDEVLIGREPSCALCIPDRKVSRNHCVVSASGTGFSLRDFGSTNQTLVNGVPVTQIPLQHGDEITVGSSVLVFLLQDDMAHVHSNAVEFTQVDVTETSILNFVEDAASQEPEKYGLGLPPSPRLAQDLNSLLKIATGIGRVRDRDSLQWQLLGFFFDIVPADCGAILLLDNGGEFSSVAWDRVAGPEQPVRVSRKVVQRVTHERIGLLLPDVPNEKGLETLREMGIRSLLCVPLVTSDRALGAIYVVSRSPANPFEERHLRLMTAVAGMVSLALDNLSHWENLRRENVELRAELDVRHQLVGESPRILEVLDFIRRVAPTDSSVLIQGESGTGKELVARALHNNSVRAKGPFVAINCAAIAETLLESELFGHEKGAFTGANAQKKGKVESAQCGTLFLDEVGELALGLQAKLLRVLQEREFERVGGTRPIKLDIRVIAATNRSLPEAVKSGSFRNDLYYRLSVITTTVPPLRDRREDIPMLAAHFMAKGARNSRGRLKPVSPEALACLIGYHWPGNVRELENALERAIVLGSSETVLPEDLPENIVEAVQTVPTSAGNYYRELADFKKRLLSQALQQADGNYTQAAQVLGLHPNSLLRLIRNLGLKDARPG
jgi:transcriptional regulator with GAF, ATPase, and Fis domain